jgi:hypothetical protein
MRLRRSSFLLLPLLFISQIPFPAYASRPYFSTESAVPIERGKSRLEVGFLGERVDRDEKRYAFVGELTYGLINNLDFEVEVPYRFRWIEGGRDEDGLGDLKLKTKVRFIKGRIANPLSISGQVIVKFPVCDENKALSPECTGEPDVGLLAIASKEFFPVMVHLNLGYLFVGNPPGGELDDVVNYSLAFDVQTAYEPVRVVAELAGETNRNPEADSDVLAVLAGVVYAADVDKFLDLALSAGLTKETPDYTLTLGFSYHF